MEKNTMSLSSLTLMKNPILGEPGEDRHRGTTRIRANTVHGAQGFGGGMGVKHHMFSTNS